MGFLGVLGECIYRYQGTWTALRYTTLRYAVQVGCGRLGMHSVYIGQVVGVCVGVGTCGRRYSR